MYLCILYLPFLSFITTNCFGRFTGIFGSCFLAPFSIFSTFLLSICVFFEVAISNSVCLVTLCSWFRNELFLVDWSFYFDSVTSVMLLVVSSVSCLVHLYSTEYLSADPHQGRFLGYLSLFTGFMLVLVSSDNFILMFFGWEGIGLASFLLIGFWFTRIQASKSAIKAMIINRIGDFGLALGISLIFLTFKSVDYLVVFSLSTKAINSTFSFLCFDLDKLTVISLLLFWGALGKSAQIGLHIWLPDAMEGPTPVSALIHAATLVTAGIFLIIRCSILFENSNALFFTALFGSLTAFFASTVGLVQNDLKRVIAFSTCSQLGYMLFSASLSHYSIALFHLANHALFKALLFLSAGCIIHGISDEQDLRKMGSLIRLFPTSYVMILIGSLALVGFPFLTGFYSKDAILEVAISKHNTIGNFTHFFGCFAALCTSFYSFRLVFLAFVNKTNTFKSYMTTIHDAPILMVYPLLFLSLGALFWGFLSKDIFIGLGSSVLNVIYNNHYEHNAIDAEFLPSAVKNIPLYFTLLGMFLSTLLIHCFLVSTKSVFYAKRMLFFRMFYTFLTQKWHFDQIANEMSAFKLMNFGYRNTFQMIDKGVIEQLGPAGFSFNIVVSSKSVSKVQSGFVSNYALTLVISVLTFLCVFSLLYAGVLTTLLCFSLVLLFLAYFVANFIV